MKAIIDWQEEMDKMPREIQQLHWMIMIQKMGYFCPIGNNFYEQTKSKYPEWFDKNGNPKSRI